MFTETITHSNMPDAIAALLEEVQGLRKEVSELKKEPKVKEWVKMAEAKEISGKCALTITKHSFESEAGDTHIKGKIRYKRITARTNHYNRFDLESLCK